MHMLTIKNITKTKKMPNCKTVTKHEHGKSN